MKYRVKNKNNDFLKGDGLLHSLLRDRGVNNPKELLNLGEDSIHDGMLFKNMYEGLVLLNKHIKNKSKIHIIIDSDFDGISSSALVYNYIKDVEPSINITFNYHSGKQHGIILEELNEFEYDLLIVPDAGSGDIEQCNSLKNEGKEVLILDHHLFDENIESAVLINCQDGEYPNKTLSGVGVAYKFCKEYDISSNNNYADRYLDLVALGMVADGMDLRDNETRYLVTKGLELLNARDKGNQFFNKLIEDDKREEMLNITGIGWKIAPLINSVVRVGTMQEKNDVFNAIIGSNETREYQPRRKSKNDPKPELQVESLQKFMARAIKNIKARQDRLVKKGVETVNEKILANDLDKNKVIVVDATDELESTFTGLVANKLANQYKRPTLVLKKRKNDTFGGSGRNYELFEEDNLMELLNKTNKFEYIKGHENAFGMGIKNENIHGFIEESNELLKNVSIENVHHVDYEIPVGRLKEKDIIEIGKWVDVWGNTLQEPLFAITDIHVNIEDIQMLGSKKNIIRVTKKIGSNNITFIKLFTGEKEYNKMIMKSEKGLSKRSGTKFKFDIIGKFKVNNYEGRELPQIEIVDYNVSKASRPSF